MTFWTIRLACAVLIVLFSQRVASMTTAADTTNMVNATMSNSTTTTSTSPAVTPIPSVSPTKAASPTTDSDCSAGETCGDTTDTREANAANPTRNPGNNLLNDILVPAISAVAGCLVLVLVILLCVFVRRRNHQKKLAKGLGEPLQTPEGFDDVPDHTNDRVVLDKDSSNKERPDSQIKASPLVSNEEEYDKMEAEPPKNYSILVSELEAHVGETRDKEAEPFKDEFERIPEGQTASWEFGMKKSIHREKNRFGNIVAYDHSRVPLVRRKDDASEYINANFLDGYKQPKAFIAAQGPMTQTVYDFWRMCWEHNVPIIVMVTNCIENGRVKSEEYWPNEGENLGTSVKYGEFVITRIKKESFSDFVIRYLKIQKDEETRELKHFQFTGWPDHGVPRQATPLLTLRRRVRAEMAAKAGVTGPTVIHCSAGVGRSGTFIALDYLLDQADQEGKIDVFACVWHMRYNRVNMVQTWDQYNFIYDALLEAVTVGQTTIPCYLFSETYPKWLEPDPETNVNKLQQQLRILDVLKQKFPESEMDAARKPENKDKNRSEHILAPTYYRPYLQTRVDGTTDYINAVFVQGYYNREAFIITQSPLPQTRIDFWRLIYDYGCHSIVCLEDYQRTDASTPPCWPEVGSSMTLKPFTINNLKTSHTEDDLATITELALRLGKEKKMRQIQVFSVKDFVSDDTTDIAFKKQFTIKAAVKRWQQQIDNKTVVVFCRNGVDRCGLYCALDYVIDMMEVEQEVDVFQAVRQVQMSRPQLVSSITQYTYLYDAAQMYMDINMAYSNFQ